MVPQSIIEQAQTKVKNIESQRAKDIEKDKRRADFWRNEMRLAEVDIVAISGCVVLLKLNHCYVVKNTNKTVCRSSQRGYAMRRFWQESHMFDTLWHESTRFGTDWESK